VTRLQTRAEILAAISAIDRQMQKALATGPGSVQQLEAMRKALVDYTVALDSDSFASSIRGQVLSRVIADSWPLGSELGAQISKAEAAYLSEAGEVTK
jgi:hypothetical protein